MIQNKRIYPFLHESQNAQTVNQYLPQKKSKIDVIKETANVNNHFGKYAN